jgi:hypothetical protein
MRDETNPVYQEWKRKRDAGVERKRKEDAEWKKREEKPGFKLITRGPRKGQLVRKNYHELKAERRAASMARAFDKQKTSNDAYDRRVAENYPEYKPTTDPIPQAKRTRKFSPEILLAFLVVFALSFASFLAAKALATLGILGIVIFVDIIAYWMFGPKGRRSKYLPLIWWL